MATYLLLVAGCLQLALIRRMSQTARVCRGYDSQLSLENEAVLLEQPRAFHFMIGRSKASSEEPHSSLHKSPAGHARPRKLADSYMREPLTARVEPALFLPSSKSRSSGS